MGYEDKVLDQKTVSMGRVSAEEGQFDGEEDGEGHEGDRYPKNGLTVAANGQRVE